MILKEIPIDQTVKKKELTDEYIKTIQLSYKLRDIYRNY